MRSGDRGGEGGVTKNFEKNDRRRQGRGLEGTKTKTNYEFIDKRPTVVWIVTPTRYEAHTTQAARCKTWMAWMAWLGLWERDSCTYLHLHLHLHLHPRATVATPSIPVLGCQWLSLSVSAAGSGCKLMVADRGWEPYPHG